MLLECRRCNLLYPSADGHVNCPHCWEPLRAARPEASAEPTPDRLPATLWAAFFVVAFVSLIAWLVGGGP